jgi:DNA-directed RNA polymerase subunit RPC12/RpoP
MDQGFCMKCKAKVEVRDGVYEEKQTVKGVKCFIKGLCVVCGTRVSATVKRRGVAA